MALAISAQWRQIDGGMRYALDTPREARRIREWARYDRTGAESSAGDVLVTVFASGEIVADRWPGEAAGAPPPWTDIHEALRDE